MFVTSKRTVLLWGRAWWIAGRTEPTPFADMAKAAAALAAAWPDEAKVFRLIYEPEGFATIPTACPLANRATLAFALSDQHPELAVPGIAWSHEPILGAGEAYGTLLHLEAQPALHDLVHRLADAGFTVTGAWPLPTWLNGVPSEVSKSGAVLVAAFQRERACLYRHSGDGVRTIERWLGPEALPQLGGYLRQVFAKNAAEPVWLVPREPALVAELDALVPLADKPAVEVVGLPEALGRETVIPSRHPAQLLPPAPMFTVGRAVVAASVLFLLAALGFGGNYARNYIAWQRDAAARTVQKSVLRAEIAHLRANAMEIAALQARVAGTPAPASAVAVLAHLGASLPPDLAWEAVEITARGFTVAGWLSPGTASFEPWLGRLRAAKPGWPIAAEPPGRDGAFRVRGAFAP